MAPRTLRGRRNAPLSSIEAAQLRALSSQQSVQPWLYHSNVKFYAEQAGDGPYTYVFTAGTTVTAFSYGVDGDKVAAGYIAADGPATYADTNLQKAFETKGAQQVRIKGLAIQPLAMCYHDGQAFKSDPDVLAFLSNSVAIDLGLDADLTFRVGTIPMVPGAGGLHGAGQSQVRPPGFEASIGPNISNQNNGWPVAGNFFAIPRELYWNPAGQQDSQLKVRLTATRGTTFVTDDRAEETDPANAASNISGFTAPAALVQGFKVILIGETVSPRSDAA